MVPRRGLPRTHKRLILFGFIPKKPVRTHHMVVLTRWQQAIFGRQFEEGNQQPDASLCSLSIE